VRRLGADDGARSVDCDEPDDDDAAHSPALAPVRRGSDDGDADAVDSLPLLAFSDASPWTTPC
jgi:hypothetical protein